MADAARAPRGGVLHRVRQSADPAPPTRSFRATKAEASQPRGGRMVTRCISSSRPFSPCSCGPGVVPTSRARRGEAAAHPGLRSPGAGVGARQPSAGRRPGRPAAWRAHLAAPRSGLAVPRSASASLPTHDQPRRALNERLVAGGVSEPTSIALGKASLRMWLGVAAEMAGRERDRPYGGDAVRANGAVRGRPGDDDRNDDANQDASRDIPPEAQG